MPPTRKTPTQPDEYIAPQLPLSSEEIAQEEREKRELLEALQTSRPGRPRPDRAAPESLSSRITHLADDAPAPIVHDEDEEPVAAGPAPELVEAQAELAALEEEISVLQAEQRAAETASQAELAKLRAETDLKLAAIRSRRDAAERQAKRAREAEAGMALAARAEAAERLAKRNEELERGAFEQKQAAVAERLQPLIKQARRVLAELRAIDREHGDTLRKLAGLGGWKNAPATWPVELRLKFQTEIILPAAELAKMLSVSLSDIGIVKRIDEAQRAIEVAGEHGIADVAFEIGCANDDLVRALRVGISEINSRYEAIEERGIALAQATPPEVVVLVSGEDRRAAKSDLIYRGLTSRKPTHAEMPSGRDKI
jgi:hypothetical protein